MKSKAMPTVEQLYEIILRRSSLPLPGFEDGYHEMALNRARRIHDYLFDRADRIDAPCMLCGEKRARHSQTRHAYDTPWDNEPVEKLFCSDDCDDTFMHEEPFAYFWCDSCDRDICEQNPMNGWHIQYRDHDGHQACLRCYKGIILDNGMERENLEAGQIPGMFFSHGNTQAIEAGYTEVIGFTDYFVNDQESLECLKRRALELMDNGGKVVIGYERLAIDGSEGYVTLMVKS